MTLKQTLKNINEDKGKLKVYILLFSIVLSFCFAELVLRIHYANTIGRTVQDAYKIRTINRPYYTLGYLIRPSAHWKVVYELKPSMNVTFTGKKLITNSDGWREEEFKKKDNDTFRIIGIGDSYMFGWGVEVNERYMDALEIKLNEFSQKKDYETYTLAVPGYNFVMSEEVLEKYGMALEPDMVIYEFVNNDFCLPNFLSARKTFWSYDSFILLYMKKALRIDYDFYNTDNLGRVYDSICNPAEAPSSYESLVGRENFEKTLLKYERLSSRTKVIFFAMPALYESNTRTWLESLPKKYPGIIFIFSEGYKEYLETRESDFFKSELVLSAEDLHYSVKGHDMVADLLYNQIAKENIR